jgi:hypothetical protein
MRIKNLQRRKGTEKNKKLNKAYNKMQSLIEALDKKEIPSPELVSINERIDLINSFNGSEKDLIKILKKTYIFILTYIEKNLKLVLTHHFRALWLFYGTLAGVVLTSIFTNFDFLSINGLAGIILPIAVAAGIVTGIILDNNVKKEGRQLEIEAKEF